AALATQTNIAADTLEKAWQVRIEKDLAPQRAHPTSFAESAEWKAIERIGAKILAIERKYDRGTVVLLAESGDFADESTAASDRLDVISAVLGGNSNVIFDESHLEMAESGSVVPLARRFRLAGFAVGLAICAALWIWRAASAFPPPRPARGVGGLAGR